MKLTFKSGGHCEVADSYLDYSFRRKKPSEVKRSYLRKEKYLKELESKLNNVYKVEEELLDFEELFGINYANVIGHDFVYDDCLAARAAKSAVQDGDGAVHVEWIATPNVPRIEIVEKFQSVSYNEYHELNFTEQLSVIYEEVTQCDKLSLKDYNRPAYTAIEREETEYLEDPSCVFTHINSIEVKAISAGDVTTCSINHNNNKYTWACLLYTSPSPRDA